MVKLPEEINFYFKYFRVKVKSGSWGPSLGLFSNFAGSAGLIWFYPRSIEILTFRRTAEVNVTSFTHLLKPN